MVVADLVESHRLPGQYEKHDEWLLNRKVNLDLYCDLKQACQDLINVIADDTIFCDAEWNLMHLWYKQHGFSEDDWEYIEACGYCEEQFD